VGNLWVCWESTRRGPHGPHHQGDQKDEDTDVLKRFHARKLAARQRRGERFFDFGRFNFLVAVRAKTIAFAEAPN
jgi:hypothetical protein